MAIRKATGEGDNGLLQIVLALCTIPACVGMVASARNAYRMRGRGRESGALLLPALLGCVWLLESYRANASDPVLWDYVPLLLAVGLGLLFSLDCAGLSFGAGHARRTLWLAGMTVVLCAVALASIPGRAMTMLLAGQLLAALSGPVGGAGQPAPPTCGGPVRPALPAFRAPGQYSGGRREGRGSGTAGPPGNTGGRRPCLNRTNSILPHPSITRRISCTSAIPTAPWPPMPWPATSGSQGCDVMFLTGTDEHGQKIEDKAAEAGSHPKEYVDHIVEGPAVYGPLEADEHLQRPLHPHHR